jgi:hypothetical protein
MYLVVGRNLRTAMGEMVHGGRGCGEGPQARALAMIIPVFVVLQRPFLLYIPFEIKSEKRIKWD